VKEMPNFEENKELYKNLPKEITKWKEFTSKKLTDPMKDVKEVSKKDIEEKLIELNPDIGN
jgi:hypothetical protein